jgi:HEAT repeat protein
MFFRLTRRAIRTWLCLVVVAWAICARPLVSAAQDVDSARRDVTEADDFRLRVSAALVLGKSHAPGARPLLEQALSDGHPAVRTAAAAALAVYGDPGAIPALERASNDASASVRAQVRTSLATLRRGNVGPWQNAHYVVQLGEMKNRSGVRGEQPSGILRSATHSRAAALPGVVVADSPDALAEAANRHLPVLALDGAIQRLTQGQRDNDLLVGAQVEFSVRRIPEQSLKGTLSGSATSIGSVSALANPNVIAELQNQAIEGAVESALRGAPQGFEKAAK